MTWHFYLGYLVLSLLLFRVVWGFVGGHWSRFAQFVPRPTQVWRYARELMGRRHHATVGHNPMGALSVLSMLLLLGSVAASLWLSPAYSVAASTLFVIIFNWFFIPPRASLHVALDKHLLLLVTMPT